MLRRTISFFLTLLFCLSLLPAGDSAAASNTAFTAGNSDLNIRNGGVMLRDGGDFYFAQDGIFVQSGESVTPLSADRGKNLNLWNGYIYYTVGNEIRRIPKSGGAREIVCAAGGSIDEFYVVNGALEFTMSGAAWRLAEGADKPEQLPAPANVAGLIPTAYGNLYLTGGNFSHTVWTGESAVLSGVTSCYTDSGYLAVQIDNRNYMVLLSDLFNGFDRSADLQPFAIHGTASLSTAIGTDDENTISEWNDNNELQMDFAALLRSAGLSSSDASLMDGAARLSASPAVSQGQRNIVKRAHQLADFTWTPLENITQWGQRGLFTAGTTYTGIPYGQPVNTNGYLGYGVSLENFAAALRDNTSKIYTNVSSYNKIAPYYSTDCSGYVSYCWGLTSRKTTYSLSPVATKVGDQSIYSLQVGDILNETSSHVVLISDLTYDTNGNIVGVEIMEETPVITRTTRYGQGESRSLASLQSYYLNRGFVIYRNPERDNVQYTPSPVVQLAGETPTADPAPVCKAESVAGGKKLTLSAASGTIYYTTNGAAPTTKSARYTGPVTLTDGMTLRAIAVSGNYPSSAEIKYSVALPQTTAPTISVTSGTSEGGYVSSGSQVTIKAASGATIYYTLDGTAPTAQSSVYSGPITLTRDTAVKAYAAASGMRDSGVVTASYKVGTFYTITASADSGGSVSPSGSVRVLAGSSRSFSISAANGYRVLDVVIDGVSVGAVSGYTFKNISGSHSVKASFQSTATLPFTDVPQGTWYYSAVSNACAQKLFEGTSSTTFEPELAMTRGMFVIVLGRCAGVQDGMSSGVGLVTATGVNIRKGPSTSTAVVGFVSKRNTAVQVVGRSSNWYQIRYGSVTGYIRDDLMKSYAGTFRDLSRNLYYSPYAEWASLTGIATGTTFNADAAITREDMCLMLYRYTQFYEVTLPSSAAQTAFTDDASISSGAKTAVYALRRAGIINGTGDGAFCPKSSATRAQVAQIFMNFSNAV